jgi:hypothetical protein
MEQNMSTKKERMYERIEAHGKNLITLFDLPADTDPVKLCKKLRTLELKASALTLDACNTGNDHGLELVNILGKVKAVLFPNEIENRDLYLAVFINGDPRGYALKIKSEYCVDKRIERDWGGYGLIAPDFSNE